MTNTPAARPPIILIEDEADALSELAVTIESRQPQLSELLAEEIERAEIVARKDVPSDVVTLGSTVTFVDQKTGDRRKVQLVFPKDADLEQGRLSILTPVGAGLIGLRTNQSIRWPDRSGEERTLAIETVEQPQ